MRRETAAVGTPPATAAAAAATAATANAQAKASAEAERGRKRQAGAGDHQRVSMALGCRVQPLCLARYRSQPVRHRGAGSSDGLGPYAAAARAATAGPTCLEGNQLAESGVTTDA